MNRKIEARRKQILQAAFQAVFEKGFNQVTLQDIAEYADVSKGVTAYYFKNKEDVLLHLLEWLTNKIYQKEYEAISKESSAINKLKAYLFAVFASPEENQKFYRVYLDFLAQGNHNKEFRMINETFYKNCWSIGREIVQLGQNEGVFEKVDIENAAWTIRALIDGSLIQWLMRDNNSLHANYRDNCFTTIVTYLTNFNSNSSIKART